MQFFLVAFLNFYLSYTQVLYKSNQFATGADWKITNAPISTISGTDSFPYQFTQIMDGFRGLLRMRYNFTNGSFPQGQVKTTILQTVAEDCRVDAYEDVRVDLTVNLTDKNKTIAYASYIQVNYWVRETKNRTIKVYFWKSWVSYCSNQPITLSGLQYSFREVNPDEYVFEVCSQSQTYSNTTFDFTELNRYLISQKLVSVWDARREVNVSIQVSGAGELTFVQRAYYNERKQYIFPQNRSIGGYFMVNEPFYTIWRSLDFINISLPVNGSTSGIISEAYFTIPNVLYPLRGHHWLLIGNFIGKWLTPIGSYGLPASVHTDIKMPVNFSFTAINVSNEAGCAAAFFLNFRSDYNPNNKSFSSKDPFIFARQVIITAWATDKYTIQKGQHIAEINYYGVKWSLQVKNRRYYFRAKTNLNSMKNFNLFVFIRYLRDIQNAFPIPEYLVTLQAGFRYTIGRGKFIINEFAFKQTLEPLKASLIDSDSDDSLLSGLSSCYIMTNDTETCSKADVVSSAVKNFLSVPAIGVLMRMSPVISLIDEYSFYVFHRANYDRGFQYIIRLCSQWTNNKWVPPFLQQASEWLSNLTSTLMDTTIDGETIDQTNKFYQFGKGNNFYNNVSDFMAVSLPLSLAIFVLCMSFSWLLRKLNVVQPLQSFFKPFGSIITFWSSNFADNLTYLSFHCFLYLYKFVPYAHGQNSFPSSVLCIVTLFISLLTVCFLGFAAWIFAKAIFEVEHFQSTNYKSYAFYSIALAAKFFSGFLHAYVDNERYRILGLLIVNCAVLIALAYCLRAVQFKAYIGVIFVIYVFKAVLHLNLFFELWKPQITDNMERSPTENSLVLVISIFGLLLLLNISSKLIYIFETLKKRFCNRTVTPKKILANEITFKKMNAFSKQNSFMFGSSLENQRIARVTKGLVVGRHVLKKSNNQNLLNLTKKERQRKLYNQLRRPKYRKEQFRQKIILQILQK